MNEEIKTEEKISLVNAVMIIGLSGWGNAGEVATFTVKYLADKLNAKKFGEILPEKFHDYLMQRPIVSIEQGVIQSYISPKNELFYWKNRKGGSDILLLLGSEPHLGWSTYAEAVLALAKENDVKRIFALGGYLADVSHEIETPIMASTNNKKLITDLMKSKLELTNYKGPTSVYSEILWKGRERNIDVVSIWCAVPMYIRGLYPEATYSILKKIVELIGLELDLKDLKEKAELFKAQLEKETIEQPQLRDLIENLRRRREKEPSYIF